MTEFDFYDHPGVARDKLSEILWSDPGAIGVSIDPGAVIGVAAGLRDATSSSPKPTVLTVFINGSHPGACEAQHIPTYLGSYPVRVQRLRGVPKLAYRENPRKNPPRGRVFEQVVPGCSISIPNGPASTLGAFMSNGDGLFFVTTAHSVGSVDLDDQAHEALYGLRVMQSAAEYGKPDAREIGSVVSYTRLRTHPAGQLPHEQYEADLAVIEIDPNVNWDTYVSGIGQPRQGTATWGRGRINLQKYGQASGYSRCQVKEQTANIAVEYAPGREMLYNNQIILLPRDSRTLTKVATGGDSGSVVWNNDRKAVGMIVAVERDAIVVTPWEVIERLTGLRLLSRIG